MKYTEKDYQEALGTLLKDLHEWWRNDLGYSYPHRFDVMFYGSPGLHCSIVGLDLFRLIPFVEKHHPSNLYLSPEGIKALAVLKRYRPHKRYDGSPSKVILPDEAFRKAYHKI